MSRLLLIAPWVILLVLSWLPAFRQVPATPIGREGTKAPNENLIRFGLPSAEENAGRRARRDQFADWYKDRLQELFAKQISLSAFADQILLQCLTHYPEHLDHINQIETGESLREKIARNALRVHGELEGGKDRPSFEAMHVELERALRTITQQP